MKINKGKLRKLGEAISKENANEYDRLLFNLASGLCYNHGGGDDTNALTVKLLQEEKLLIEEKDVVVEEATGII